MKPIAPASSAATAVGASSLDENTTMGGQGSTDSRKVTSASMLVNPGMNKSSNTMSMGGGSLAIRMASCKVAASTVSIALSKSCRHTRTPPRMIG